MKTMYHILEETEVDKGIIVLTVITGAQRGEKALLSAGKIIWQSEENGFLKLHQEEVCRIEETTVEEIDGSHVYAEVIGRAKHLVICGGGHVGLKLIAAARLADYQVTLIEDRPLFAGEGRKAGANEVICDTFERALEEITGNSDTYYVIVTRGHSYDDVCLKEIVKKPYGYIGMIGSRRKTAMAFELLRKEGVSEQIIADVHAPIGLNIGAKTPAEIAVAILAEIIETGSKKEHSEGYSEELLNAILKVENIEDERFASAVLCTIVGKKGSAPREVGAKMLVLPDGGLIGTIGGGCVEADVISKARQMMAVDFCDPVLFEVNLTNEQAEKEGMVCGGRAQVFMEMIGGEMEHE